MAKLTFYGPTVTNDDNMNHFKKLPKACILLRKTIISMHPLLDQHPFLVILIEHTYSL